MVPTSGHGRIDCACSFVVLYHQDRADEAEQRRDIREHLDAVMSSVALGTDRYENNTDPGLGDSLN